MNKMLKKLLIILFNLITFPSGLSFDTNIYGYPNNNNQEMLEAGKIQFQLLQERGTLPQYGSCWRQAIQNIEDGCRNLSEETQRDIALHLANCFLEMSEHATYECIGDKKPNLRRICLNSMSDRAFNVYTEFYTHTQNMCWFLRGQIWHEEIDRNTRDVGRKIEESSKKQDELLHQQEATLKLQQQMLNYSSELNRILGDFYLSSQKHHDLLGKLASTLINLQNWLIGEISWFDTVVFYVSVSFLLIFFTSTRRTINARFVLILLLASMILFERILCYQSHANNLEHNILLTNKHYYDYIWTLRYIFIATSAVLILVYSLTFKDYLVENNALILQLHEQITHVANFIENSDKNRAAARKSILNIESEIDTKNNDADSNVLQCKLNDFNNISADNLINKKVHTMSSRDSVDFRNNSQSRQLTPSSEISFESNASRYNLRSRLVTPTPDRNVFFEENSQK